MKEEIKGDLGNVLVKHYILYIILQIKSRNANPRFVEIEISDGGVLGTGI